MSKITPLPSTSRTVFSKTWKDRNGIVQRAVITDAKNADDFFRAVGWPGHSGGFWNYLKADIATAVRSFMVTSK